MKRFLYPLAFMGAVALLTVGTIIGLRDAFAATTYYVDATCPTAGNGTSATCSSGVTTNNPKKLLSDGIALLTTAGDVLNVRGIHAAHNTGGENCPGDTEGRYYSDQFTLTTNITGAGATIQPYGYTGVGTGETVYIDGTMYPTNGWTQCTDCSAGSAQIHCQNVPGTCGDAYYTIEPNSGTAQRAIGAQKRDGTPTYRVLDPSLCTGAGTPQACCTGAGTGCGLANLTNSHAGYTGTSPEIDSTSPQIRNAECLAAGNPSPCCTGAGTGACNWITVKWGSQTPGNTIGNRSYIFHDNNAVGFQFNSNVGGYTIRGLNVRAHRRQGFGIAGGTGNNITITDNHILYNIDRYGGGSDYGIGLYLSTGVTISGNEFGWMGSEAIHEQGKVGGVSANTISNNWIHDSGDRNVLGPAACGTPSGMILTDDGAGGLSDYTGSVTSGNLIVNMNDHSPVCSVGRGIILENNEKNMIVRDNVISNTLGEGIKLDASGSGHADGNQIFNNLIISNGGGGNGYGIWFAPQGGGSSTINNLVYNNTVVNGSSGSLALGDNGTVTGNVFRNNIFYTSGSQKQVSWSNTQASNIFENNLVVTSGGTAATWGGAHVSGGPDYTCAQMTNIAASNIAGCPSPQFANAASDYHLLSTSPAKDVGTSTGMPSTRLNDINNTVASAHGFVAYNDNITIQNGTWDIGMDEIGGNAPVLTISKTDSPDPVVAGANLTYTIAYQNTGTASATGVTIKDTIPANETFVSATAGGTLGAGVVTWTIGTVAAGASASVQLTVAVGSPLGDGTILTNGTYSILSNELATVNGAAVTTTVTSQPVLSISKTDSPDPVTPGSQTITYTIAYSNTGNSNATSVVISDTVPAGTTYLTSSGGGVLSAGVVTWTIGTVNAGTGGSVQLIVTANSPLQNGTVIHNSTYSITSAQVGPVAGTDNTTTVSVPQVAGGLQFPYNARATTWPALQTFSGGITSGSGPFQTDNAAGSMTQTFIGAIIDPAAPIPSAGPSSGGTCRNDKAYRFYVSYQNSTGTTKLSAASTPDFTPSSGTTNKITVTRPPIGNNVTNWIPWYAEAATPTTIRGCGTLGLASTASPGATTFDCFCGTTQDPVEPATNTTSNKVLYQMTQTAGVPTTSRPQITEREVCSMGCDYTTIPLALAGISDASATNRYIVIVHSPYNGTGDTIVAKSYVSIIGENKNSVITNAVQIPGGTVEFAMSNIWAGVVSTITSGGAGGWIYLTDMIIGSSKTAPTNIDGWYDTTGGWNVVIKDSEIYSNWDTIVLQSGGSAYLSNNNYRIIGANQDASCWMIGSANPAGVALYDTGSTCTVTTSLDPDPNFVAGFEAEFSASAQAADNDVVLVNPVIRLTSTNAGHTTKFGCFQIRTQGAASGFANRFKIINPDCYVSGSANTPLYGLSIDSDTDHSNYEVSIIGGRFNFSGGSVQNDVDNADTNVTPRLVGVLHTGTYSAAGGSQNVDGPLTSSVHRFPTLATKPSTCSIGDFYVDTSGAYCTCSSANTWTNTNGVGSCV